MESLTLTMKLQQQFGRKRLIDYIPERDDYLQYQDDLDKIPEWLDGTETSKDIEARGMYYWRSNGGYHRDNDKPALIDPNLLHLDWFYHGQNYRENDKPNYISGKNPMILKWEYPRPYGRPSKIFSSGYKMWTNEFGEKLYPEESIIKSIKFDQKGLVEYIKNIPYEYFTFNIQKTILEINPSLISIFPRWIHPSLKEDFYGHYALGEICL